MGDVLNRGTKDHPLWYCRYVGENGVRRQKATHQPTRALALLYLHEIEARIARGQVGIIDKVKEPPCCTLMEKWRDGLANRSATRDRYTINKRLIPKWSNWRLSEISIGAVMEWLDQERAAGERTDATIRHYMNLLSRFFGWCIERGHASANPVRQIPVGRRPHPTPKGDVPWIADDAVVRKLFHRLPAPIRFIFYLGNRSGLRTGELAGLRLSDLGFLQEGLIRVRFSYDAPLKEDKAGVGKVKWVPAPSDAEAILGPWLVQRKLEGAQPENLAFPHEDKVVRHIGKMQIGRAWHYATRGEDLPENERLTLTWYQATRHSFVSRNLAGGASLDEVAAAVGHSSPVVTRRYYDHFIRSTFSEKLRAGLGIEPAPMDAEVVPIDSARRGDGPYLDQSANTAGARRHG